MQVFPEITFSLTEMQVLADKLSDPAVVKYLHYLAYVAGKDIALNGPAPGEPDAEYLRRVAGVRGRIEALDTLLKIAADNSSNQPTQ